MKKVIKFIVSVIIIGALALGGFYVYKTYFSKDEAKMPSPVRKYNDNISYKLSYASYEDCPGGNVTDDKLNAYIDFTAGKDYYYMAVDVTLDSFDFEGWNESFNITVKISEMNSMEVKLEEARTSTTKEEEANGNYYLTAIFKIPEDRTETRTYRLIVSIRHRYEYYSSWRNFTVGVAVYGDNQSDYDYVDKLVMAAPTALEYVLNPNKKSYTVTGLAEYMPNAFYLYIPESYKGLPVTTIGEGAFQSDLKILTVIIPENILYIEQNAFDGCSNLVRATFENPNNWDLSYTDFLNGETRFTAENLDDIYIAANSLRNYGRYRWERN